MNNIGGTHSNGQAISWQLHANTELGPDDIRDIADVASTGNDDVDSIIYGSIYSLDPDSDITTISYSYVNSNSFYSTDAGGGYGPSDGDAEPWVGTSELTSAEKAIVENVLTQIEGMTKIDFVEVIDDETTAGTVRFAWTDMYDENAVAWGYLPLYGEASGDIWLQTGEFESESELGSYFHTTLLHEIGHAVGLTHSFDADGDFGIALRDDLEGNDYTVMSYTLSARHPTAYYADLHPQTYMYLDILALRHMYGKTAVNGGDTTYEYNATDRYYLTIFDTDGTDTIKIGSAVSQNLEIDLSPNSWIDVGTTIYYQIDTGGDTWDEVWEDKTVFIPPGVYIENAYAGSGDDTIGGNTKDNILKGGRGEDSLSGARGADELYGNGGADALYGGKGYDALYGGKGHDALYGGKGYDALYGGKGDDDLFGNKGNDDLYGNRGEDILVGGSGSDNLYGGSGADRLVGGKGDDFLTGGADADAFDFRGEWGDDTIVDFQDGLDMIDLSSSKLDFNDLTIQQSGTSVLIEDDNGNSITLLNATLSTISEDDFLFT